MDRTEVIKRKCLHHMLSKRKAPSLHLHSLKIFQNIVDVCWSNQLFYYLLLIFLLDLMEISFSYAWNMRVKYFVANKNIFIVPGFWSQGHFSFNVKILITKRSKSYYVLWRESYFSLCAFVNENKQNSCLSINL